MRTILGKLVSGQPISLSKASRYISDFASFENNGASEVVSIYLNRASEAFTSLVQLHKDLKHPQSFHKKDRKKSSSRIETATNLQNDETMNCDDGERKNGSCDKNQEELEDKRVVTEEVDDGSVRISGIENMGMETSKKKKKDNTVNGFVDQTRKKSKNENAEESAKKEVSVDGERRVEKGKSKDEEKKMKKRKENERKETEREGEMEVEQRKKNKKKKREEIQINEMRGEVKLDVGQEMDIKKKK